MIQILILYQSQKQKILRSQGKYHRECLNINTKSEKLRKVDLKTWKVNWLGKLYDEESWKLYDKESLDYDAGQTNGHC